MAEGEKKDQNIMDGECASQNPWNAKLNTNAFQAWNTFLRIIGHGGIRDLQNNISYFHCCLLSNRI